VDTIIIIPMMASWHEACGKKKIALSTTALSVVNYEWTPTTRAETK
jgi:hypothetical protein